MNDSYIQHLGMPEIPEGDRRHDLNSGTSVARGGVLVTLPKEVCFIILEFCGMVKNRNGKYIRQISKTDVRYSLLQSIPKPKDSLGGKVFTGCCVIELRVDIKKTIENMNYHFSIVRVFANDSTRKCYQMVHLFQKHDYLKRNIIISNEICEYL